MGQLRGKEVCPHGIAKVMQGERMQGFRGSISAHLALFAHPEEAC